ncbi:hypothetical protein [Variovorax soli]|uniref:Uncharacterized protein n=1 Tax=Variovorax soli TaxID=376815 RepID=A0ABU1NDP1_9BURK|nr:hypothetical protein [Variovorax soli]MDR6536577.1 hypothetical protein [Variovorax soli]
MKSSVASWREKSGSRRASRWMTILLAFLIAGGVALIFIWLQEPPPGVGASGGGAGSGQTQSQQAQVKP